MVKWCEGAPIAEVAFNSLLRDQRWGRERGYVSSHIAFNSLLRDQINSKLINNFFL